MRLLSFIVLFVAISLNSISQELTLSKRKKIRTFSERTFIFFLENNKDSSICYTDVIKGIINSTHDNFFMIEPEYRYIRERGSSNIYSEIEWYFPPNSPPVKIYKNDISRFTVQSKKQKGWETFGYVLLGVGVFTTSTLAPLVSIDYKNFDINSKTYRNVAVAGLIMIGVSIPISKTFKGKWYCINSEKDSYSNCWKLK